MSVLLRRKLGLETVAVEPFAGLDGQGMASYGPAQDIEARVHRAHEVAVAADGSEVRTGLTLWVRAGADPVPGERDRVTYLGDRFIGVERREVKKLDGTLSHVRLRLRDE